MSIEEYKNTFNILREQKYFLINKLKEKEEENLQTIMDNIFCIDKKINKYDLLISNKTNNNNINFKNTNISIESYKGFEKIFQKHKFFTSFSP